jgi:Uma2 family endonuclease
MGTRQLVTAEELLHMERPGRSDYDFELVRGELVRVTPTGGEHGILAGFLTVELGGFVRAHRLGTIYVAETGFVLSRDPDTVRAPDVSFVSGARSAAERAPRGFVEGPPDLAIEIRSPENTRMELAAKTEDYLAAGARLVWIVEPRSRQVQVHRPNQPAVTLSVGDRLEGGDVVPGFELSISDLFTVPLALVL